MLIYNVHNVHIYLKDYFEETLMNNLIYVKLKLLNNHSLIF